MVELEVALVERKVAELCQRANHELPDDLRQAIRAAREKEKSPTGRMVLEQIIRNAEIAGEERLPLCQDTGMVIVFVTLGQEVHITGGSLEEAINRGVARGYCEGYLRKSIVSDPLHRCNTGDNTPAIIHYELVPGGQFTITVMPKGFGSENCSALGMLKPAEGVAGIKEFVVEAVDRKGPNPCPPFIVGVGIGGTSDRALLLAKRALLRPLGSHHPDPEVAALETELTGEINHLGYGPAGLGGSVTTLGVLIETAPTHIAGLPVAVNINCHVARHMSWVWDGETNG